MQKFEIRKAEHEDPNYNSEPARHIAQNKDHEFVWKRWFPRHNGKQESSKKQFTLLI